MTLPNVDYYVGLLSVGLFYGATHQKPARFQVITNKRFMIPEIFIQAWRKNALWQTYDQIEQDLIISRALVDLF